VSASCRQRSGSSTSSRANMDGGPLLTGLSFLSLVVACDMIPQTNPVYSELRMRAKIIASTMASSHKTNADIVSPWTRLIDVGWVRVFRLLALVLGVSLLLLEGISSSVSGSANFRVTRLVTLPTSLRAFGQEGAVSIGVAGSDLWVSFAGLSTEASPCYRSPASCVPTKPTPGILVEISPISKRIIRTRTLATLPELSAAGAYVWVAASPSLPSSEAHDMPAIAAIGGGLVRKFSSVNGAIVAAYRIPDAMAVQAYHAIAFVISSEGHDFYGTSQLLEIDHGVVRTLLRGISGVPLSPQSTVVCGRRLGILTTDQLRTGSRMTLTVTSLSGKMLSQLDVTQYGGQELSCFDGNFLISTATRRSLPVEALVDLHAARFVAEFRASVLSSVTVDHSIWFSTVTNSGYAIGRFDDRGLSIDPNVPQANGILPTEGGMVSSNGTVYYLLKDAIYEVR